MVAYLPTGTYRLAAAVAYQLAKTCSSQDYESPTAHYTITTYAPNERTIKRPKVRDWEKRQAPKHRRRHK
jgi:hypothetical protein